MERAIDWIFSHMDEPGSEEDMEVDHDASQNIGGENLFVCN